MDGTATMSEIRQSFRTPLRILVPKLLKSRNDWKAKSDRRQAQLKSAKIKIRDLSASRAVWRERAEQFEEESHRLREQVQRAEREREEARAALARLADAQKK